MRIKFEESKYTVNEVTLALSKVSASNARTAFSFSEIDSLYVRIRFIDIIRAPHCAIESKISFQAAHRNLSSE